MTTKIVEQLKTGNVKNVIPYGTDHGGDLPYCVVKPERDPLNRGRVFRIIGHFAPGQQAFLEDYIFNEVPTLLDRFKTSSRHGSYNVLLLENDYTDIIINNSDGSISMERTFSMAMPLF